MKHAILFALLGAGLSSAALAQDEPAGTPPSRAAGPPVEAITTSSAVSTEPLGSILGVRELPDGRVLVNDGTRRRLLLMDTTLQTVGVVLDSLTDVANTYGTRPGTLIPYRADSTLFVDPASYAMLVLDPAGKIARVRSVWRVQDLQFVTNQRFGFPAVDAGGRVVYRIAARAAPPRVPPPAGIPYFPPEPDSAFVIAVNLDTRLADTLGMVRTPRTAQTIRRNREGRISFDQAINPLPSSDDWAVLPDGTVAFVRARDYRIEYLAADGSLTSSPKLPYEWQQVTDEDKRRMVDSIRAEQSKSAVSEYVAAMIRWTNQANRPYPAGFTVPAGYTPAPGFGRDWKLPPGVTLPPTYIYACAPGEQAETRPAARPGEAPPAGVHPPPGGGAVVTSGPPSGGAPVVVGGSVPAGGPPGPPTGTPSCIPPPTVFSTGGTPPMPVMRHVAVLPASELPDYRPPISAGGSVRADAEGNLWIRTVPPRRIPGGPVYDVVNRQGQMISRLQLPQGYTLVGFGQGRVVYLSMRDATGLHLARVRLR